jgi:Na+/proline symporter
VNAAALGIGGYVILQLAIGFVVSRRVKTENDFLLAGRQLGMWLATFSIFATWFGAETCMGAAGAIYSEGLSGGRADPFGYALCIVLMGVLLSRALWKRKLVTSLDFVRTRFSPNTERLGALILIPSSLMWAAAQIRALGQVLASASATELELCMAIAACVVIVYTVLGGLLADVITDLVQGVTLILGLGIISFLVLADVGGVAALLEKVLGSTLLPSSVTAKWMTSALLGGVHRCRNVRLRLRSSRRVDVDVALVV